MSRFGAAICAGILLFVSLGVNVCRAVEPAATEGYRLGFSAKDLPGDGIQVVTVNPGSPATNLYRSGDATQQISLSPGDVITAVDGTPVRSLADYYAAMKTATPGKVRITVRDVSTGQTVELATPGAMGGGGNNAPQPGLQPIAGTAKLYLVLVADTNAQNIGPSVKIDEDNISGLFKDNVPAAQLRMFKFDGNRVGRDAVLQTIRGLGGQGLTAGRDTLVVYYSGHGAYSLQASDHMMTTTNGNIYLHRDLDPAINQVRPRATVILNDACGALVMGQPAAGAPAEGTPEKVSAAFQSLFFDIPPGVLPICSAMKGQYAAGNSTQGGFFTTALCRYVGSNADQRLQWKDVISQVNADIKQDYPRAHQVAYIVNGAGADPSPRFGVVAESTQRGQYYGGVEVTRVMAGYPCQSMRRRGDNQTYTLVVNRDIVRTINGKAVKNYAEFVNAVRNSTNPMTITVYDTTSNRTDEFEVTLKD